MKSIVVPRSLWANCYYDIYKKSYSDSKTRDLLCDLYGIARWDKINLDEYLVTFSDEQKLSYWILKWL